MAVNLVNTGVGLLGGPITSSGTISLRPPASGNIGGVRAGANIVIAADGTVSIPPATTLSLGVVRVGSGLNVNAGGTISTVHNGTVTSITPGAGLGAPATGNVITTSGTISLLPPSSDGLAIGGVKAGANIKIQIDGEISTDGLLQTNNPYAYNAYIWPATTTPIPSAPGEDGQVLTLKNKVTGEVGWTSASTLDAITAGSGLTSTTVGGVATVSLSTVPSITAGAFGATAIIPTFSVNAQGQLISAGEANPYPPFQIATVTAPPNLVLDFTTNNTNWEYTLTGNLVISNPVNVQPGQRGGMRLIQDPVTPFAISWGSSWKFAGATPAAISPIAAAVDYFEFVVVSSNYVIVTLYLQGVG